MTYDDDEMKQCLDWMDRTPHFVPNLPRLAEICGIAKRALVYIKARDPLFPTKKRRGWNVYAALCVLNIRDLELQSDDDFNAERRESARDTLRRIEAGDFADWDPVSLAKFRELLESTLAGKNDIDAATGRTARQEAINDALADLRVLNRRR